MGLIPAYTLLRVVAAWYFLFAPRVLYPFFRERLHFSKRKAIRSLYVNYYQFGQSLIDKVAMMASLPQRFTFDFDGEGHLHDMVEQGRGGLLLSAHIGNWEIAGHLLQRLKTRIHILMYDGEHERIKHYLEGVTGERSAHIILIKDDLSHIYEISNALKNNELVCMHADRFVEGTRTLETDFLGKRARFPLGPFVLATTYRVPVSFVFALKERPTHYHFFASAPIMAEGRPEMEPLLKAFVAQMEEKVKRYPEQWYNYYKFWNQ